MGGAKKFYVAGKRNGEGRVVRADTNGLSLSPALTKGTLLMVDVRPSRRQI